MDAGKKIIVANTGDDSLSVINLARGGQVSRIELWPGAGPHDLIASIDKKSIFVTQAYGNSLLYMDLYGGNTCKTIFVGCRPEYIAMGNDGSNVYLSNSDSDSISIVSTEKVRLIGQVSVGSMPQGIDCHPTRPILAVANMNSNDIWFIETGEFAVEKKIHIGSYPSRVRFSRDGKYLYVSCSCSERQRHGYIAILQLSNYSICKEIATGANPSQIYESRDGRYLLAASIGTGCLEVIDIKAAQLINRVETDGMAHSVVLDSDERYAYVTNPGDNTVSVVDWRMGRKNSSIAVGKEPNGIIYMPS